LMTLLLPRAASPLVVVLLIRTFVTEVGRDLAPFVNVALPGDIHVLLVQFYYSGFIVGFI